jgi:hypothetical protein
MTRVELNSSRGIGGIQVNVMEMRQRLLLRERGKRQETTDKLRPHLAGL